MRGVYDYEIYKCMRVGRRVLACFFALLLMISYSGDAFAADKKTESENAMRMTGGSGVVSVTTGNGKKQAVTSMMRLENGSTIATASKSYAYVSLDSTKSVKLDSLTKAEVRKGNNKYEVLLNSGNLFFNVISPLKDGEIFNIRTSNMSMSIKGTCAQVEVVDSRHTRVCLLEGSLNCKITSFKSGESKTVIMLAGQAADFYLTGESQNDCKIVTEDIKTDAIRAFVLEELYRDKNLSAKIYQQSGLDFRNLTQATIDDRMRKDQNKSGTSTAKNKSNNKKSNNKNNSKKAIQMNFLEDHDEGKLAYTSEGKVIIIPECVSVELIRERGCPGSPCGGNSGGQNNSGSSNNQNNNSGKRVRDKTQKISAKAGESGGKAYEIIIPSPKADTVINNYFEDL